MFVGAGEMIGYMHVEGILSEGEGVGESAPLVDYLFRYDRGGFYVGRYACEYFLLPNTEAIRWTLNNLFNTRACFMPCTKAGSSDGTPSGWI